MLTINQYFTAISCFKLNYSSHSVPTLFVSPLFIARHVISNKEMMAAKQDFLNFWTHKPVSPFSKHSCLLGKFTHAAFLIE